MAIDLQQNHMTDDLTQKHSPFIDTWSPLHVWNWLHAWGVSDLITMLLYNANVNGEELISLSWDAYHKDYQYRSGKYGRSWYDILSHDPSIKKKIDELEKPQLLEYIENLLIDFNLAINYARDCDFLLSSGNWLVPDKANPKSYLLVDYLEMLKVPSYDSIN